MRRRTLGNLVGKVVGMRYRPELDGLRAVAVLPVVGYHANLPGVPGGFIGVDVFFVISGYLITRILLSDLQEERLSLVSFYERRGRRILPALFVVMAACLPAAFLWMLPEQQVAFARSMVAVPLFVSNVLFWREDGYFAAAADLKPLLHTWSLAVEEQFYLLFPPVMLLVWRIARRALVPLLVVAAIASFALAEWGSRSFASAGFYLLPTRAWELLAGSLCAMAPHLQVWGTSRMRAALTAAGLVMIGTAITVYSDESPVPGWRSLLPVLGSVLVILFAGGRDPATRLLQLPFLVWVGLISYSLYLWHHPVFAFARLSQVDEPSAGQMALLSVAVIGLAWATWRWVEVPFRQLAGRRLPNRKHLFGVSAAFSLAFVALGAIVAANGPAVRALWETRHPQWAEVTRLLDAAEATRSFGDTAEQRARLGQCRFNSRDVTPEVEKVWSDCAAQNGPGVLVVGDSHAVDLFGVLASRFDAAFLVGATAGGCRPHGAAVDCQLSAVRDLLRERPGLFRLVVYEEAGFHLLQRSDGTPATRASFRDVPMDGRVMDLVPDSSAIQTTAAWLDGLGLPVLWFGPRIEPHVKPGFLMRAGCGARFGLRHGQEDVFRALDKAIRSEVATLSRVTFRSQIEAIGFVWPDDLGNCTEWYFSDGDHYSAAGEERFGRRLTDDFLTVAP